MEKCFVRLEGEIEKIPEADNHTFLLFCQSYDFHLVDGPRRAWCPCLGEYMGDADYLFHAYSGVSVFIKESDIIKP